MKMLAKMLTLVVTKFEGKTDKGGKPYFLHCLRVMMQMPQVRSGGNEDAACQEDATATIRGIL